MTPQNELAQLLETTVTAMFPKCTGYSDDSRECQLPLNHPGNHLSADDLICFEKRVGISEQDWQILQAAKAILKGSK